MPPQPSWITRIPEILADLRQLDAPVADRHICELLFGVRRRRAIELMQRFGGYRSGNSILLDRCELIASLERVHGSPEVTWERRRKQRLGQQLDELHRSRAAKAITLPVSRDALAPNPELPQGVSIGAGRLCVDFRTAEELFARMYELAQFALVDFENFRRRVESAATE